MFARRGHRRCQSWLELGNLASTVRDRCLIYIMNTHLLRDKLSRRGDCESCVLPPPDIVEVVLGSGHDGWESSSEGASVASVAEGQTLIN